jgi:hypothetical protein
MHGTGRHALRNRVIDHGRRDVGIGLRHGWLVHGRHWQGGIFDTGRRWYRIVNRWIGEFRTGRRKPWRHDARPDDVLGRQRKPSHPKLRVILGPARAAAARASTARASTARASTARGYISRICTARDRTTRASMASRFVLQGEPFDLRHEFHLSQPSAAGFRPQSNFNVCGLHFTVRGRSEIALTRA